MPFVLFIAGLLLVITAVRDKSSDLMTLLKNDFVGANSFLPWVISILFIGSLGYIPSIKPITNAFLVLVIIVLFLSNGGFFAKFIQQTGIGKNNIGSNIAGSMGANYGAQFSSSLGSALPGFPSIYTGVL